MPTTSKRTPIAFGTRCQSLLFGSVLILGGPRVELLNVLKDSFTARVISEKGRAQPLAIRVAALVEVY